MPMGIGAGAAKACALAAHAISCAASARRITRAATSWTCGCRRLSPSRKLLAWALQRDMDDPKMWNTYVRRYRGEMSHTNARQTIRLLARIGQQIPISLGCHCRGTTHCHRFELERLIREAGKGS